MIRKTFKQFLRLKSELWVKNTGGYKFFYDGKISQKLKDAPWCSF